MAIFKKLFVGDSVATSGTRVLKKLSTSSPFWDGTNLKGTIWRIRAGWEAEAGYGEFDVGGGVLLENGWAGGFSRLYIGYATENPLGGPPFATANNILYVTLGYASFDPTKEKIFGFSNGTDINNTRLISWLLKHGELVSHSTYGGLYDVDDNLVADWDTLVMCYGMDGIEKGYGFNTELLAYSPYRVLTDNSELSAGTKMVIPQKITSIGTGAFSNCSMLSSFTIPNSVVSIGYAAFYKCPNLTDVYYLGTEEQWNAITIDNNNECLTNATIHYISL